MFPGWREPGNEARLEGIQFFIHVRTHTPQDPSVTYVTRVVSQTFAAGVTEMAVSLPVTQGAYLAPDATFTINITSATLTSSTGWWIGRCAYIGGSLSLHEFHHFNHLF